MNSLLIILQIILAGAMLDVWLIRYNRPGVFRGGDARTMAEEFRVYGLPDWFRNLIRILKLSCGACMLIGIVYPPVAGWGALALAGLMTGAVSMHIKVRDPVYKALPAMTFLVLSLAVAWLRLGLSTV